LEPDLAKYLRVKVYLAKNSDGNAFGRENVALKLSFNFEVLVPDTEDFCDILKTSHIRHV
jgi:hypothetical protein